MDIVNTLKNNLHIYINTLVPQYCSLCKSRLKPSQHKRVCTECEAAFPLLNACCSQCSEPLDTDTPLCGTCLSTNRYWQQCYASFVYKEPISSLIHNFKYNHHSDLTHTLASYICNTAESNSEQMPDVLIPVPMHAKRLSKRGYNHSLLLTKSVSQKLKIPWLPLAIKTKDTTAQMMLNSKERKQQSKQSFAINKHIDKSSYKGMHIAIIDDVVTTGATTTEIAKTLKKAGAKNVDVWCVARA